MAFETVERGDRLNIEAEEWNFLMRLKSKLGPGLVDQSSHGRTYEAANRLRVRNDTGADIITPQPIALGAPLIYPTTDLQAFRRHPVFRGTTITANTNMWGVTTIPAETGASTLVDVDGAVACQINVTDDAHTYVVPGAGQLESATEGGGKIIWKEAGTGLKWAWLLIHVGGSGGGTVVPEMTAEYFAIDETSGVFDYYVSEANQLSDPLFLTGVENGNPGAPIYHTVMIFSNALINQGQAISNASLLFTMLSGGNQTADFLVRAIDDGSALGDGAGGILINPSEPDAWSPTYDVRDVLIPGISFGTSKTIDLTTAIQSLVNRPGWAAGNRINIYVKTVAPFQSTKSLYEDIRLSIMT